jgi:ketosteroid isomerase-like protein
MRRERLAVWVDGAENCTRRRVPEYWIGMSQENVEIVRRVYEAVAQGDADTVLASYEPQVVWEFSRSPFRDLLRRETYQGHSGLRSFMRERSEEAWKDIEDQLEELIDAGEQVVSVVTTRGRGLASGAEVALTHAGVWTIREGLIVRVAWMHTREEALAALGRSGES